MKLHEPFVSIYHEDQSDELKFQVLFPIDKGKPVYGKILIKDEIKTLKLQNFINDNTPETDIVVAYTFDRTVLDELGWDWPALKMEHIGFSWLSRTRFSQIIGDLSHDHKNVHPADAERINVKFLQKGEFRIKKHNGTIHFPVDPDDPLVNS